MHTTIPRVFLLLMLMGTNAPSRPCSAQDRGNVGVATKLRVLLVTDTNAANIQQAVLEDKNLLLQVLTEIQEAKPGKITIDTISGLQVHPDAVLNYYRDLKSRLGDRLNGESLLFFYSGHGGLDPRRGQFLAMSTGNLYRSDLRQAMDETNARLCVILTNCCSNIAGVTPPNRRIPARWDAFKQLFFQTRGMVDITAAQDGTFAWCNSEFGGFFTVSLARLFCEPIESIDSDNDGFVTWSEFSDQLQRDTNALFLNAQRRSPRGAEIHNFADQNPKVSFTGYDRRQLASFYFSDRGRAFMEDGRKESQLINQALQAQNKANVARLAPHYVRAVTAYAKARSYFDYALQLRESHGNGYPDDARMRDLAGAAIDLLQLQLHVLNR